LGAYPASTIIALQYCAIVFEFLLGDNASSGGNAMNIKVLGIITTIALALSVSIGFADRLGAEKAGFRAKNLPYPDVTDTSHATDRAADIFEGFFTAKSEHDGVKMLTFFAPDPVLYIDAGLGFAWPSRAALLAVWTNPPFSNGPPNALSYPLRVVGDAHSALIEFEDTPALLGSEFRFLSSVTFNNRAQIVRWIDYWDGRSSQVKIPIGTLGPYPSDFNDKVVNASARIEQVSQALQDAFAAGNAAAAAQLFSTDAVYEDMALHTRVEGQF
jgi:hypothetical protein